MPDGVRNTHKRSTVRVMMQPRYDFIDVSRAIASVLVVVSHTQQIIIDRPLSPGAIHRALSMLTTQGHNAVVVFFVISGFWIVRSVMRAGDTFSFRDYMIARGTRLWIVLLPALLMGAFLDSVGSTFFASPLYEGTQGAVSITQDVRARLSPQIFLGNALFLQDIAVPALGSNGALWSIACEFWYYIYFPFLYCALRSRSWPRIVVAAALLPVLPSPLLFGCWLMGGAVYVVAERLGSNRRVHWVFPAVALVNFCFIVGALKLFSLPPFASDLVLAASFAIFMGLGIRSPFGEARGLKRAAHFGGRSYYSVYATHLPVVVFLANFIVPSSRIPASPWAWVVMVLITVAATSLGIVFSRFTERQTPSARRWLTDLFISAKHRAH